MHYDLTVPCSKDRIITYNYHTYQSVQTETFNNGFPSLKYWRGIFRKQKIIVKSSVYMKNFILI